MGRQRAAHRHHRGLAGAGEPGWWAPLLKVGFTLSYRFLAPLAWGFGLLIALAMALLISRARTSPS